MYYPDEEDMVADRRAPRWHQLETALGELPAREDDEPEPSLEEAEQELESEDDYVSGDDDEEIDRVLDEFGVTDESDEDAEEMGIDPDNLLADPPAFEWPRLVALEHDEGVALVKEAFEQLRQVRERVGKDFAYLVHLDAGLNQAMLAMLSALQNDEAKCRGLLAEFEASVEEGG